MPNQEREHSMECPQCRGSGACDPCDGYGFYPDSYPGAGDGPECEFCDGSGECPACSAPAATATPAVPTDPATQTTATLMEDVIPR
jgi:hypothetical protein